MSARVVMNCFVLATALSVSFSSGADSTNVEKRLAAFSDRITAISSGQQTVPVTEADRARMPSGLTDRDQMSCKALDEFGQSITDDELAGVADYGASKQGAAIRWSLVKLLVERGKFDAAVRLAIADFGDNRENREYRMWKWWETMFSDRKDFKRLGRSFTDALLRQFDTGNAETKLIVAELFGKGKAEAKLPLDKFKDVIHYDARSAPPSEKPLSHEQ